MIRYALLCDKEHAFEAWFRDSAAFDHQSEAGHVGCPVCGSAGVRKALMAPAIRRSGAKSAAAEPVEVAQPTAVAPGGDVQPSASAPSAPPISDEAFGRLRSALRDMHAKLKRDAVDVGPRFPQQARAIHDGDAPPQAIYGTATDDEVRSLVEDGIGILPIPVLPDDRN